LDRSTLAPGLALTTHVSTGPNEGLFALVGHATRAVEKNNEPLGVLDIELERASDQEPLLLIETTLDPQSRFSLARLDVRVRLVEDSGLDPALAERALGEFGGTAYTNLCITENSGAGAVLPTGTRAPASEAMDLTVYFPSRLPVWAKNLALIGEPLSATALDACAVALEELAVRYRRQSQTLSVGGWQLRQKPTAAQQNRALFAALSRGLSGALYAATLPTSSALRIEQQTNTQSSHLIDVALCRSMSQGVPITEPVASAIETFVRREFRTDFSDKRFSVKNTHGKARDDRLGPIERKTLQWSMNWGHRRV